MFDIAWSELLIIGVVALIVVGPKELPVLLRTVGRYVAMVKRQAEEFRTQFNDAMRESELDTLRKEADALKTSVGSAMYEAEKSLDESLKIEQPAHGGDHGATPALAGTPPAELATVDPGAVEAPASGVEGPPAAPPAASEPVSPVLQAMRAASTAETAASANGQRHLNGAGESANLHEPRVAAER